MFCSDQARRPGGASEGQPEPFRASPNPPQAAQTSTSPPKQAHATTTPTPQHHHHDFRLVQTCACRPEPVKANPSRNHQDPLPSIMCPCTRTHNSRHQQPTIDAAIKHTHTHMHTLVVGRCLACASARSGNGWCWVVVVAMGRIGPAWMGASHGGHHRHHHLHHGGTPLELMAAGAIGYSWSCVGHAKEVLMVDGGVRLWLGEASESLGWLGLSRPPPP